LIRCAQDLVQLKKCMFWRDEELAEFEKARDLMVEHPDVTWLGKGDSGGHVLRETKSRGESVLFIGTRFSNLYTAVDTPAEAAWRVCCLSVLDSVTSTPQWMCVFYYCRTSEACVDRNRCVFIYCRNKLTPVSAESLCGFFVWTSKRAKPGGTPHDNR